MVKELTKKLHELNPNHILEQNFGSDDNSRTGHNLRHHQHDYEANNKLATSGELNYFHTIENMDSHQMISEVIPNTTHQLHHLKNLEKNSSPVNQRSIEKNAYSNKANEDEKARMRELMEIQQKEKEKKLEEDIKALKKEVEMATYVNQRLLAGTSSDQSASNQHWTEGWRQMEKTYLAELRTREKTLNLLDEEEENLKKELNLLELELEQIEVQRSSLYDVNTVLDHEVTIDQSVQKTNKRNFYDKRNS